MRILSVSTEHFRNLADGTIDVAQPNVHLLLGFNGAGKTNVLEAVSFLSLTTSFLGAAESDVVRWGADFMRIRAQLKADRNEESTIELFSQLTPRKQKACFINDVRTPVSDTVGHLPTVSFLPQDLALFTGSPALRRGFLDAVLCQVSPEYGRALSQYQKILKQRNALLRKIAEGIAQRRDLTHWDALLAQQGALLILQRLELIEVFQCTLTRELQALGESWNDARLVYERKGTARDQETLREEFCSLLRHYQERDVLLQSTTVGPHREDWRIDVDGRPLQAFASRGQQRTAVLALLFLKVSFLELRRGEKPIVLLDDVFSELDDVHQQALLQLFDNYQVFVTATHAPEELAEAKVWEVKDGTMSSLLVPRS